MITRGFLLMGRLLRAVSRFAVAPLGIVTMLSGATVNRGG